MKILSASIVIYLLFLSQAKNVCLGRPLILLRFLIDFNQSLSLA